MAIYVDTSGSMNSKMRILNERDEARSITDRMFAGTGNVRRERWSIAMNLWESILHPIASMPLDMCGNAAHQIASISSSKGSSFAMLEHR